jgi:hypothetical protein
MFELRAKLAKIFTKERPWELYAFKVVMWAIILSSFVAILRRAASLNPTTLPLHYLFIAAGLAAALLILLPGVRTRISEVSFAGVKLILAQPEVVLDEIKIEEIPLESDIHQTAEEISIPFSVKSLEGPQLYHYERLSYQLYRVFDQVKDPNKLDAKNRENYRNLIAHVAKAAFAMGHHTKYLDVARRFLSFSDRARNSDENFMIGHAYLWAAEEQPANTRSEYQIRAQQFLSSAMRLSREEVKIPFNLGLCLFYLQGYRRGITLMEMSIQRYEPLSPWAKWNIAFALKKLDDYEGALAKLREIPSGTVWDGIAADEWLAPPVNADFKAGFLKLCEERRPPTEPKSDHIEV